MTGNKKEISAVMRPRREETATGELSFSSEARLQQAVAGLLNRIPGITGVQILQGTLELGKDLIFYMPGGFGEKMLCACVVKNTRITGKVDAQTGARNVLFQAEQAIDSPHTDSLGNDATVERVYVVTPFDLPPTTITSIRGKLKEKAGQVVFVGGSQLFDLFKRYWPTYIADEASAIGHHLQSTKELLISGNPLPTLAFQYGLGEIDRRSMSVYVNQRFHRLVQAYEMGSLLTTSLPTSKDLSTSAGKPNRDSIRQKFTTFDDGLHYLNQWDLCPTYNSDELKNSVDSFIKELEVDWKESQDLLKGVGGEIAPLKAPRKLINRLNDLTDRRYDYASTLKAQLAETEQILTTTYFEGVSSLSDKDFLRICFLNDCVRAAPQGMFVNTDTKQNVTFSKDIIDEWGRSLLIVGPPGFGKTSFCKWHALQDAENYSLGTTDILPVYFPLHLLSREPLHSFEQTFLKTLGQSALTPLSSDRPFRVRLYLDGLDEIASKPRREEVITLVRVGAKEHPTCQVIITSRDYVYGKWLEWIPKVYLSEFNDAEVMTLVDQLLGEGSESALRFNAQIQSVGSLMALMRTPLLATLIILVFKQTGRLPDSKTRLYEIFIDLLSGGWDFAKGTLRVSQFGQRPKVLVITALAGRAHARGSKEFDGNDFREVIDASFAGSLQRHWETLRDECIENGLVCRSGDTMYFPHLSFQEFLAAKGFVGKVSSIGVTKALENYLRGDEWWRDVLKFYISFSSDPTELCRWLSGEISRVAKKNPPPSMQSRIEVLLKSILESFPGLSAEEMANSFRWVIAYRDRMEFLEKHETTTKSE